MIRASDSERGTGFSHWLRTGRLPAVRGADGTELKFNPWHDPDDGRFTFAGSGRQYGSGGASPPRDETGRTSGIVRRGNAEAEIRRVSRTGPSRIRSAKSSPTRQGAARSDQSPSRTAEFVGGVGQQWYDDAKDAAAAAHAILTTNPVTTIRATGRGIAGMIDDAIAAEDTPARVQLSRAAARAAAASPSEIGHAVGSVTGNVVLTVVPGAALGKVAALRRARLARPAPVYKPVEITWIKERLNDGESGLAKLYNDAATGARADLAPALKRTMPDGSKRFVKFDGIDGNTMIDRKLSIRRGKKAEGQALRQSAVLAEHNLIGVWEVPSKNARGEAIRFLRKVGVRNIKTRIVKP